MSQYKMTKAPWAITGHTSLDNWIYAINGAEDGGDIICICPDTSISAKKWPANASAIVSAVNGTYGVGINPDGVKAMYDIIKEILSSASRGGIQMNLILEDAKRIIENAKI